MSLKLVQRSGTFETITLVARPYFSSAAVNVSLVTSLISNPSLRVLRKFLNFIFVIEITN
jgi:hypothetical protein